VEDAATRDDSNYSLGSVVNHVLLQQTVIGQEAKRQMEMADAYPTSSSVAQGWVRWFRCTHSATTSSRTRSTPAVCGITATRRHSACW